MALLKRRQFKTNNKQSGSPSMLSSGPPADNGDGNGPNWGDFFQTAGFGDSLQKALMEPSNDINKMALKSVFATTDMPDMREVIACYERYKRFNQTRDIENLMLLLASAPAVGGLSRTELMQGGARILAESALQHSMDIRTGGLFQKNNNHRNQKENKMHYPPEQEEGNG